MKEDRGSLDTTLAAMFSNMDYRENYLFYAHLVGQCSIKINKTLPACAGVLFNIDHYELYINPDSKWGSFDEYTAELSPEDIAQIPADSIRRKDGIKELRVMKGFDDFVLVQRLAILKHEMLHIVYDHLNGRIEFGDHKIKNYAFDCALNQHVDSAHLPPECITPKTLGEMLGGIKVKTNESSEFYYNLIEEHAKKLGEGSGDSKDSDSGESGQGNAGAKGIIDSHDLWEESKGDADLKKDITKKMVEHAQENTIKSKGKVPNSCADWIKLFTAKSELNWKKVLRGIVGNKRVGSRSTIMKNDRRFPKREDLRGKTKDRTFNLLIIADVSGSMSDKAIIQTLGEVKHICDVTKTSIDLIQVDCEAYEPEKLSKNTSVMKRKGSGGTYLNKALEKAKEQKIDFQALVVISDGGLFGDDITYFQNLKKKVIWLIESSGDIMQEMNSGKMKAFKLSNKN